MGISILDQLTALASALALGGAVGLLYDCFRILRCRVRFKPLGGLLDLLFWIAVTLALFFHALEVEQGVLRLYTVLAVLGGAVVYFLLLSPVALFLGYRLADFISMLLKLAILPVVALTSVLKKIKETAKKSFHYRRKWYKIRLLVGEMDDAASSGTAARKGRCAREDKTCRISDQASCAGATRRHRKRAAQSETTDSQRTGGQDRTGSPKKHAAPGQRRPAGRRGKQRRPPTAG